jgi:hypothetical protein
MVLKPAGAGVLRQSDLKCPTGALYSEKSGWNVKLLAILEILPKLRTCGFLHVVLRNRVTTVIFRS